MIHPPGHPEEKGPDLWAKCPWASEVDRAREMWNHAGKVYGKDVSTAHERPRLSAGEVADLLAYIRSTGGTREKGRTGN